MAVSRRRVLQGGVAAVVGSALGRAARAAGPRPAIRVTVTAGDGRRLAAAEPLAWGDGGAGGADTITVDPAAVGQPVLGFGAAFTEAACVVLHRMPAGARAALLAELLGPDAGGLSVARLCIGASDYSTAVYSYDEGPADVDLARFSVEPDRAAVLPVLREAVAARPDLFLFASPWSPPGWMKYGGSMLGGTIRLRYLQPYAHYVLKYLQAYAAAGVAVSAVTVQNELGTEQDGRMPACVWSEEAEAGFVADHLGPLLRDTGVRTQIWIHDHNYDMAGRVMDQLAKAKVRPFVGGVAWHGYAGRPEQMGAVYRAHPDVPMHWTEGGPGLDEGGYGTDWCRWSRTFADVLRNGCRSITAWNLALDEHGNPNVGPFRCGGLVTVDSATAAVTRSGMYYAMAHYARPIRRGAHVVGSNGTVDGVSHVAAVNVDGSTVLVLTNSGAARTVRVTCGGNGTAVNLPADAVVTLEWA